MESAKNKIFISLVLVILVFQQDLLGQNIDSLLNNKRVYHSENIGLLPIPKIDGLLDDDIWTLGQWQGDFTQQFPEGGKEASEKTYVKLLYDRSNLYVAFKCMDSEPDEIRDILGRRDARSGDNAGIALDSYHDQRTAFEFSMTAAGQKMDLKHLGDYSFDYNWDAVWDGATSMTDSGWIAEMKLPFSQLRYANQDEHVWGLHFFRVISRKLEADNWHYIPREAPAMVYLFGELKGLQHIRSSRQVELLPYGLASLSSIKASENAYPYNFNGGLDAKVGISSDYTLDLSVNPDFGQVEADPSVLNLTSFETFFSEKRPFFLEGNDVFDFEIDGDIPYYSRRIGSAPSLSGNYEGWTLTETPDRTTILGAAKLTGKSKKGLSVGVVNGLTARETSMGTNEIGWEKDIEVSPLSNYLASRIKKDFKDGNTILGGVFSLVNRISSDSVSVRELPSSAISGGLDLLHYWKNRNYYLEVKTIASQLSGSPEAILLKQLAHNHRFQRPDAIYIEVDSLREHLSGHGGLIRAGKKGGKWNFHLEGQYRSPGLNLNDMGFIRQSDYVGQRFEISFDMNKPGNWIRDYFVEFYQEARWSFGGENIKNQLGLQFELTNNQLWWFKLYQQYDFSTLDTRELRGGPALRNDGIYYTALSMGTNYSKDLYAAVAYQHRWLGVKHSNEDILGLSVTWLPVKRLNFSAIVNVNQRQYHQQYVTTIPGTLSDEYIVGNIDHHTTSLTFRGELYVTPELSLQYYGSPYYSVGDYDSFRRVDEASARDLNERLDIFGITYDGVLDRYSFGRNMETFTFNNPDFSFMQFRSNLVFRWEYKLGSTLYIVWSHDRSGWESVYNPVRDITGDLFGIKGNHVFMVKLNFWFSI
ncbi:MAG: carbohydrate binding family 9 domain-containing protein [Bacteroidales bacterium]|nr:carbohydrate binding family 9 domain-containing protein [Bacteroidales bacterium]